MSDNTRRWTDDRRGVYEVWYLTWNDPETGQGFWLRYLIEAPVTGPRRAELWFARFDPANPDRTFGIHKRFDRVLSRPERRPGDKFTLLIGDVLVPQDPDELIARTDRSWGCLQDRRASGELVAGGHDVSWDFGWPPAGQTLRLLPDVMYARGGLGETTVLSPNPRVLATGIVRIDGENLVFENAVLGQTHLWGKKHAYSWTWGRCAEFAGAPDALLELLGVRLQRRGVTLPPMFLLALDLDGEHHRLNQFRHVVVNRATWRDARVVFSAWSPRLRVEGELTCRPEQMISAPYLDPDGTEVFCANTEIGDAQIRIRRRSGLGWGAPRTLEGRRRAHFEIGGRTRDPSVVREHVLV